MSIHVLVLLFIIFIVWSVSLLIEIFEHEPEENEPEPEARTCPHDTCQANKRVPPQSNYMYNDYLYLERELKLQVNHYQKLFLESQGFKFDGAFDNTVIFYMTGELQRIYRTQNLEDVINMYQSRNAFPTSDWVDYNER